MARYEEWNRAIIDYFTAGMPHGAPVFLNVDDETLDQIARQLPWTRADKVQDFVDAVRACVAQHQRLSLSQLHGQEGGQPHGVAFLSAMVLAAARMEDTEEAASHNYFHRLRQVLQLPPTERRPDGRPEGMEQYEEVSLWVEWNRWLRQQGFVPTARRGDTQADKYINYPISQALLRRTDRERLRRLFEWKHLPAELDADTLLAYVRVEASYLPDHLRDLLACQDQRSEAVAEAIHELYEEWQCSRGGVQQGFELNRGPHIFAKLYRVEDALDGEVRYYMYPQMPRRYRTEGVVVRIDDTAYSLEAHRPGWYRPVGPPIGRGELEHGARYTVVSDSQPDIMILPRRPFWVLIRDPDNPDSGDFATWGRPVLHMPFVLLCRQDVIPQLASLKDIGLLNWVGSPYHLFDDGEYVEFRECYVLSRAWGQLSIEYQPLVDALRPNNALSIVPAGGLRAPGLSGWLAGYGPEIYLNAIEASVHLRVVCERDGKIIFQGQVAVDSPVSVDWGCPGVYRVEVNYTDGDKNEDEPAMRRISIVSWDELRTASVKHYHSFELGDWTLCGGYLKRKG